MNRIVVSPSGFSLEPGPGGDFDRLRTPAPLYRRTTLLEIDMQGDFSSRGAHHENSQQVPFPENPGTFFFMAVVAKSR
jgi:hypothetical protein